MNPNDRSDESSQLEIQLPTSGAPQPQPESVRSGAPAFKPRIPHLNVTTLIARLIAPLRFVALVAVFSVFMGSFAMFYIGAYKAFFAIKPLVTNVPPPDIEPTMKLTDFVVTELLHSLDSFLFALVLLYTAYGIFNLVISRTEILKEGVPASLVPTSIDELKQTLAVVIIIILFVLFLELGWSSLDELTNKTWELLVYPIAIALLAMALWLLKLGRKAGK